MTEAQKAKMLKDINAGLISLPTYEDGTVHTPTMDYLKGEG